MGEIIAARTAAELARAQHEYTFLTAQFHFFCKVSRNIKSSTKNKGISKYWILIWSTPAPLEYEVCRSYIELELGYVRAC